MFVVNANIWSPLYDMTIIIKVGAAPSLHEAAEVYTRQALQVIVIVVDPWMFVIVIVVHVCYCDCEMWKPIACYHTLDQYYCASQTTTIMATIKTLNLTNADVFHWG